MTDLETTAGIQPDVQLNGQTLLSSNDKDFAALASTLAVEDLLDAGLFLTQVSKVSAVRVGMVAYEIRQQTADGEWGRRVFELAQQWEVSERTIHRWMRSAQSHFDLELTPAQKNAEYTEPADVSSADAPDEPALWDETAEGDELGEAGFDLSGDHPLTDWMNEEAGWAGDSAPQPQRGTPEEQAAPAGRPLLLEPDPTWLAFTAHSIMQEHEGYSDTAAERSAKARWARQLEQEPLDLLEDLEQIYEATGGTVPDDIAETLLSAEETKAIKPDEVTEGGKKKRGPKSRKLAYDMAENMLATARQLHEMCFVGLREGTITDREVAGMLPHLQLMPHAITGLQTMARAAKERALAAMSPEEKIQAAEAQAAKDAAEEETDSEDPGF